MIYLILELLESGGSFDRILEEYPQLTQDHIRAALHYAAEITRNSEYVPFHKAE